MVTVSLAHHQEVEGPQSTNKTTIKTSNTLLAKKFSIFKSVLPGLKEAKVTLCSVFTLGDMLKNAHNYMNAPNISLIRNVFPHCGVL